jgi:hypothetical protein
VNSPPPKPEVILTNFFAEPTVLLVPINSRVNTFCKNNIFFYLQINFEEIYDLYKYKLKLLKTSSSDSG